MNIHEFAHYLDFKTNNAREHSRYKQEKFAREYSVCACKNMFKSRSQRCTSER